jgi:hypothetical protein
MSRDQKLTILILVTIGVLLGVYDIWVAWDSGATATISWMIWQTSKQYPALAFGIGFLCGHLFGSMPEK